MSVAVGTKMRGLLRLFRFELPFAAGVCVLLGQLLALGRLPEANQAILGFLSVFFISATSLILNDYFDLESDKINAPERPLPSGMVTPSEVVILSLIITLLGFAASYPLGAAALSVAVLVWAVGFLYNWRFKRSGLWGNLLVSFSVGMTFIFGGLAVGELWQPMVWFFAIVTFLIDLGEEIAADAMDMEGDQVAGSRSLALLFGRETALRISGIIFAGMCLFTSLPFLLHWIERVYLIPILLMDTVILVATLKLLDAKAGTASRRRTIRWIYLSGLAALILFIFMRLWLTPTMG